MHSMRALLESLDLQVHLGGLVVLPHPLQRNSLRDKCASGSVTMEQLLNAWHALARCSGSSTASLRLRVPIACQVVDLARWSLKMAPCAPSLM